MSAIATVLRGLGHDVTGSDLAMGPAAQRLQADGIDIAVGHRATNLRDAEIVVASTAVPQDNPELVEARSRGLLVWGRFEVLSALASSTTLLSVSGTHGKTTTASMLTVGLTAAGADPSYLVGAEIAGLGAAAGVGRGEFFVLEADESDGSFLAGPRAAAVVTNIEADHLEYWGGWEQLLDGFATFLGRTDGPRIVCADDPNSREVGRRVGATTFGVAADADHRVVDLRTEGLASRFTLENPAGSLEVRLAVPGLHNALDAAAALAVICEIGGDLSAAAEGLSDFTGAARRFERRGRVGGVEFVDDYAHLPTEVRAALSAARAGGWGRVVAVFQPHRYSRTEALWREFADAFDDADVLVLTDIYPAGESPRPGVTGELLLDAVREARPSLDVRWRPTLSDVVDELAAELRDGDLCISIGAGDVTSLADRVQARLEPGAATPEVR